jgi:hypothetical protein
MVATTQQPQLGPCSKPAKSPSGQMWMECTAQIPGRFQKQCACPASATTKRGSCLTLEQMCCIPGLRFQPCATAYPSLSGTSSTWQHQVSLGGVKIVVGPSLTVISSICCAIHACCVLRTQHLQCCAELQIRASFLAVSMPHDHTCWCLVGSWYCAEGQ